MSSALLYSLVILAHVPGMVALIFWQKCWRFPILLFAFIGMLLFNAAGSIGVFSEKKIYSIAIDTSPILNDFALILTYQVIAFYFMAGIYIALRHRTQVKADATRADTLCVVIIAASILIIGYLYFLETGTFLLLANLDGSMNIDNALSFREKYVYGLRHWPLYNLAFVFLPILLSNYGLIIADSRKRYRFLFWATIIISFSASLSLGSKGGIINFVLSLGVAHVSYLGMTGSSILMVFRNRGFISFAIFASVVLIIGYLWATPYDLNAHALLQRLWYRIFVAYPEALAAAISYANQYGSLGESAMPTIRGLLQHEQVNLASVLHAYLAGSPGGLSVPMAGELFITAGWPGIFLGIPFVYVVLVMLQEIAFCLTEGLTSVALSALYAYLAIGIYLNGMFASLFNFMYPGTVLVIGISTLVIMQAARAFELRQIELQSYLHD